MNVTCQMSLFMLLGVLSSYDVMRYMLSSHATWDHVMAQLAVSLQDVVAPVPAQNEKKVKNWSKGRTHGAFCRNGWASRQVEEARQAAELGADRAQNLVKAVFSKMLRGRYVRAISKVFQRQCLTLLF